MVRQWAIALFWAFTVYAFVARSILQKLRIRDTGIRGITRDRGVAARLAGVLMPPAWLTIGVAPLVWGHVALRAIQVAGLLSALVGLAVAVASQRAMGTSWRIGVKTGERARLVRHGPFRWVRNPFFTGMALVAVGTTATAPSVTGALAVACLLAVLVLQVRLVEEPHLLGTFGDEYRAYAREAGRFVPGLGRLRS
jgi:protein-S-isoprenylcysteine O-methyltransferase Ste14